MPKKPVEILKILNDYGLITLEQVAVVEKAVIEEGKDVEATLLSKGLIKDKDLGQLIANIHGWRFVNLQNETIDQSILRKIPREVAAKQKVIVFGEDKDGVKVAMNDPDDITIRHLLQKRLGTKLIVSYATKADIHSQLTYYDDEIAKTVEQILKSYNSDDPTQRANRENAIIHLVDAIIKTAYAQGVSDVHFEPESNEMVIRFRIDGVLHDIVKIPKELHDLILSRIKVLSLLRTDEHQTPQDGKIRYEINANDRLDIRVSIVPTTKGENVVMRLLPESNSRFALDDLGLSGTDLVKLEANISKPWGAILVTGPTGSGKTTSLYAVLKVIDRREINIATIEDPVEYNFDGITQIQVNPRANLTFASGLRSLVRQDPDVIMVGEIRDQETADIAINSAMTGHLVLSTLHTNDSATTLPRIIEMGLEPFLVASTINLAIGQRLIRKICKRCITSYEVSTDNFGEHFHVPDDVKAKLFNKKELIRLYKGQGCPLCQQTGYRGRIGVFELLEMTDAIRDLVMENADAETIKEKAVEEGMTTMLDDGILKVLSGQTTVDELIRVIKN